MREPRSLLRELPSIDRLLTHPRVPVWFTTFNREYVIRQCRVTLDDLRSDILRGHVTDEHHVDADAILSLVQTRLDAHRAPHLTRVVNASGTILHTNLGRAPLAPQAVQAATRAAAHPSNLEYELARGGRGRRESEVERLLTWLTGAEAATVVNNNAAAVLVAVNSLAAGKDVIVSRGELVEIGGAFRIPDIVAKSGATLREVGTTNRTHASDYERAIGPATGLLLKVHTSNYRIVGFSSDVSLSEMTAIGKRHGVPVVEDLGSGALVDLSAYGLPKEPLVSERVVMGADLVTFSGDKLLGGPQAGLIVGTRRSVALVTDNPLHRAVRCDKMTLAALEATLRLYQQSPDLARDIPTLAMLTRPIADIAATGERAVSMLRGALGPDFRISLEDATSQIGSGALPTDELPTKAIAIVGDNQSAEQIAERFRAACPPIIGRIKDNCFLLDVRTIDDPGDLVPCA